MDANQLLHNYYFLFQQSADFLNTELYRGGLLVLDIWTLIHFFSGIGLMLILFSYVKRRVLLVLFLILLSWEVIAIGFSFLATDALMPEVFPNHVRNLLAGMIGGTIGWGMAYGINSRPPYGLFSAAGLAGVISFLWVITYGYRYNHIGLNTPYFNFFAFTVWSLGLCSVIALQRAMEGRISHVPSRLALIWGSYFFGLVLLEFVGYELLGIHEVSKGVLHPPLLLGLIHGTVVMKTFYLIIGIVTALLDQMQRKVRQVKASESGPHGIRTDLSPNS